MRSNSRISLEDDATDADTVDAGDFDTTVRLDVEAGTVTFHAAWSMETDAPPDTGRHSVVLVLDCDTMERYAGLDDGARMRVHAMLHEAVRDMLDRLPDNDDDDLTLTVELTDAMLDAAIRLQ
ncbi:MULTISPECIES: hypothetical protein [Burkholderia]|uniref:DUF3022 domain-containing protein n=1 Tax=Burkholderia pyrrocinia TaxID=60550 RepID=A0A318IQZ2_BURPY|nr:MULTISPECIES: hypothetical protein [Burkholderia]PXX37040.1 hypothetical protein NA66_1005179 [Burkholderia pyrrocinia]SFW49126.1 hypothetical protein SAMN03159384_02403 [Burkholderia sp. NFACC33-1]SFY00460.1 hypothetical protein SAMN03159408_02843 [Burkholderia sp. NFPP32]